MVGLFDTHCHLVDDLYKKEWSPEDLIKESFSQGVNRLMTVSCSYEETSNLVEIATRYPEVYASLGVHPNNAKRVMSSAELNQWYLLTEHSSTAAIGECGLDYHYDGFDKDLQKKVFVQQIEFAISQKLPLIIHCRDAFDDLFNIIEHFKGKITGVIHCFSGTLEQARRGISLGFKLGFGGIITFANAGELREVVTSIPVSSILLETDSPYLSPVPYRGTVNRPSKVKIVANKVASLRKLSLQDVTSITTANAFELFTKCR